MKVTHIDTECFKNTPHSAIISRTLLQVDLTTDLKEADMNGYPMGIETAKAFISQYLVKARQGLKTYYSIDKVVINWLQRTLKGNSYEFLDNGINFDQVLTEENILVDVLDVSKIEKQNCFTSLGYLSDLEISYVYEDEIGIKPKYVR